MCFESIGLASEPRSGPMRVLLALTMLALSWQPTAASALRVRATRPSLSTPTHAQSCHSVRASPKMSGSDADDHEVSVLTTGATVAGLVAQPIVWVSLYSVATTGGGLPAGPFGLVGLLEGLSYLAMVGFVGAAVVSKVRTGSGLPAGPNGLLGLAEGLSFFSLLVGLVVLAYVATGQGCVPNAMPIADYSDKVNVCRTDL